MFRTEDWQSDAEYRRFLREYKVHLDSTGRRTWREYQEIIAKLKNLNLDQGFPFLASLYSPTGRPAKHQAQIIRSFILFAFCVGKGWTPFSLTDWVEKEIAVNPFLAALIGCTPETAPPLGSYYDLMDRFWGYKDEDWYSKGKLFLESKNKKPKSSEKPHKGEKADDPAGHKVATLATKLREGKRLTGNAEAALQVFFYLIAVLPSFRCGIISSGSDGLTLSGDGTCIHVAASPYGHSPKSGNVPAPVMDNRKEPVKVSKRSKKSSSAAADTDKGIPAEPVMLNWKHYSDPDATWGWDSDLNEFYFGFTLYHLTAHNPELGVDVPVLLRFTTAKRHDSLNLMFAMDELKAHEPEIKPDNMCLDSAHDNYPTYELFDFWHISPYIDLNKRRAGQSDDTTTDADGTPICKEGLRMHLVGYDKCKRAYRYRCPLVWKNGTNGCSDPCSTSKCGRTVYKKSSTDIRLYPKVPRGTEAFKKVYNNRTSCERVNTRILHDYKLENARFHNRKHYSFYTMIIGICIHMDARFKAGRLAA